MASGSAAPAPLVQFAPQHTAIAPAFWAALAAHKIEHAQLADAPLAVRAHYAPARRVLDRQTGTEVPLPPSVAVEGEALAEGYSLPPHVCPAWGTLKNFNTVEEFKTADKQALFNAEARSIYEAMLDAADPTPHLARFLVLSFADLKRYRFVHWFAYPALVSKPAWVLEGGWKSASDTLGAGSHEAMAKAIEARRVEQKADSASGAFFLLAMRQGQPRLGDVADFASFFQAGEEPTLGFVDPSAAESEPGWPLRNLLALVAARFGVRRVRVLCWKDDLGADSTQQRSVIGAVALPDDAGDGERLTGLDGPVPLAAQPGMSDVPLAVGWERNSSGKLAPKLADLGPLMDPRRLADQAVDLNLKLMRWRIMPDINLERIQQTKCLLLGAGTLGCYVARTLLGWGVRHITLLDSSRVSFSNPVRQPLFDFDDCLEGGKPKAECAAARLRAIYPGVTATGVQLNVPMPGHPIQSGAEAQVRQDAAALEKLIDEHDVVYLLMDSRESRWLPTLLGAAKNKLVINAALGFDTYLVMRHGAGPDAARDAAAKALPANERRLGCYYCNDIVAPADSLTDRTLDQMCTVTRPGLAAIAGASAVELMVSVLQHKDGVRAPAATGPARGNETAPASSDPAQSGSCLGLVPHQIRGFLAQFSNMLLVGGAYDLCTACSPAVIDAYKSDGFAMLKQAFNDESFLERVTGLDKMKAEAEAALGADLDGDWSEDGEEGEGELL